MGIPITKEVVEGALIDPSLGGGSLGESIFIETDAIPEVEEFLRNAVGEETCFLGICWDRQSAEKAKQEAAKLLRTMTFYCSSVYVRFSPPADATIRPESYRSVITKSSVQSAMRYLKIFSDGDPYSYSEIKKAQDNVLSFYNLDLALSGSYLGPLLCYEYVEDKYCKWVDDKRISCKPLPHHKGGAL